MDLFASCRNCLQCLPFFNVSPPAHTSAPSSSSEVSKAKSAGPAQASERLASPAAAAAPAVQEQDLRTPLKAEQEPPQDVKYNEEDAVQKLDDAYSVITESETVPTSGIVIAPPVSSLHSGHSGTSLPEVGDDDKATALPEVPLKVPYINDITFSASGSLPIQSPSTPALFGPGQSAHQYPPRQDQIYQGQNLGGAHSHHSDEKLQLADENTRPDHESVHHENSHSHHGHGLSHQGHVISEDLHSHAQTGSHYEVLDSHEGHASQHSHVHAVPDYEVLESHEVAASHEGHVPQHSHMPPVPDYEVLNPHDGHVPPQSHVHTSANYEVPHPDPPLDNSNIIQEPDKGALGHDLQHQSHDSSSESDVEDIVPEHTPFDGEHHEKTDNVSLTPPLEVTQSTPELGLEATMVGENSNSASHTNGASASLETYYSEPVVVALGDANDDDVESPGELVGPGGVHLPTRPPRRRHQFRENLKGFKQQIKQGGLHLKEEGTKHMLTIVENMNKQAQQLEQSGRFFTVPRSNND